MTRSQIALIALTLLALTACRNDSEVKPVHAEGDLERGRLALTQYACHSCHVIPGITGSSTFVGPSLSGMASRPMIAGKLPNSRDNMMRWIMQTQDVDPGNAMPDMGVTEQHARDMVTYLDSLK
ncbi:MAG: c-type cytochrome [Oxalicibacterium faecigallinarum]|uniref:Cytochrome c domain-containing protein n=1 Tax=Oxalicibacterium faecigallinarum TaxID=573741 RepID=A0A8J3AQY4_9BURK|nr:c-type cytochrome [Oxalicibacterium faecigallinarum]MDQ7970523.1 c-type cytochrome [Oxalicibacterium faecigallinarum]GGI17109.1 hypothetical protein GCM10008066_07320 [Oxalicibacterium faecigallinarum]